MQRVRGDSMWSLYCAVVTHHMLCSLQSKDSRLSFVWSLCFGYFFSFYCAKMLLDTYLSQKQQSPFPLARWKLFCMLFILKRQGKPEKENEHRTIGSVGLVTKKVNWILGKKCERFRTIQLVLSGVATWQAGKARVILHQYVKQTQNKSNENKEQALCLTV